MDSDKPPQKHPEGGKRKGNQSSLDLMLLNAEKKFTELFRIDPEVDLELLKS